MSNRNEKFVDSYGMTVVPQDGATEVEVTRIERPGGVLGWLRKIGVLDVRVQHTDHVPADEWQEPARQRDDRVWYDGPQGKE